MKIGRILSAFMILALVLATGLRGGPMAGCMTDAPAMGMADVMNMTNAMDMADEAPVDAKRTCDETGKAKADAATTCHGICVAPMMPVDVVQPYVTVTIFAAPLGVTEWRDTASSPDPHPPRPIPHI